MGRTVIEHCIDIQGTPAIAPFVELDLHILSQSLPGHTCPHVHPWIVASYTLIFHVPMQLLHDLAQIRG